MEPKDKISLLAITATFIVALINLVYTILNNRKTAFVNTVTASRLKWIDSRRDKNLGIHFGDSSDLKLGRDDERTSRQAGPVAGTEDVDAPNCAALTRTTRMN